MSARHTILPVRRRRFRAYLHVTRNSSLQAWRPLLVFTCQVGAIVSLAQVATLVYFGVVRARIEPKVAWAWYDLSALALLSLDGLVPSIVTQHAVSRDSFRRSVTFAIVQFATNTGLLIGRITLQRRHRLALAFLGAALLVSAGLLPAGLLLCTLTGAFTTRVRLHSRTHTAAFVLYICVDASWMLSYVLRATSLQASDNAAFSKAAILTVFVMLSIQTLLPWATKKTLVADTKFWRGLGRYNANARFRDGLRLSELCVLRTSSQSSVLANISLNRAASSSLNSNDGRVLPPDMRSSTESRRASTSRRRPEMGLEVASAKLQDIIETANRDKSMLEFAKLTIDRHVIGRGTTAFVYRGLYKDERVAVKVFNPAEITEEYVATFGHEIHIMAQLRHRNILMLYGLCVRPPQILAVFELCEGGSLAKAMALASTKRAWTLERKLRVAFDCSSAVAYLHGASVWHRDIKLDNFLVAHTGAVKLCDFGESLRRTTAISRGEAPLSQSRQPTNTMTPAPDNVQDESQAEKAENSAHPPSVTASAKTADTSTTSSATPQFDVEADAAERESSLTRVSLPAKQSAATPSVRSDAAGAARSARSPRLSCRSPRLLGRSAHRDVDIDDSQPLEIVGTPGMMAPELIAANRDYTEAVDIFALGIVLRCIWTAEADPWPRELQTFDVFSRIERGERPPLGEECPPMLAKLVNRAWAQEPGDRPDAETLRHGILRILKKLCGSDSISRLRHHVAISSRHSSQKQHTASRATSLFKRWLFPIIVRTRNSDRESGSFSLFSNVGPNNGSNQRNAGTTAVSSGVGSTSARK